MLCSFCINSIKFFPSTELQEETGTENMLNFLDTQRNFILQIEEGVQVKSWVVHLDEVHSFKGNFDLLSQMHVSHLIYSQKH